MHPRRLARLNQLILQSVSQSILRLKDPEVGFVTILGAETSPDVSLVRIHYSVLGSDADREKTKQVLERAKSYVKREIGQLENLKRVPNVLFVYDSSTEKADRVSQILQTIHRQDANKD